MGEAKLLCSKCRSIHMVPMDYPNEKLGLKCMLCCHEVYFRQIDMVTSKEEGRHYNKNSEYSAATTSLNVGRRFSMDFS